LNVTRVAPLPGCVNWNLPSLP